MARVDAGHPRLKMPKYIGVETRSTNPWASVEHTVEKAYRQMPDKIPVGIGSWGGRCPSLADYVMVRGPTDGAPSRRRGLELPTL
jgi:hypothetical protein